MGFSAKHHFAKRQQLYNSGLLVFNLESNSEQHVGSAVEEESRGTRAPIGWPVPYMSVLPVPLLPATRQQQAGNRLLCAGILCVDLCSRFLLAVRQAPVHQGGDQGCERRAREEPAGAGANAERAHQRAQVQVSPAGFVRAEHTPLYHGVSGLLEVENRKKIYTKKYFGNL